jgi:putative peptidoglycan lipid II flippase
VLSFVVNMLLAAFLVGPFSGGGIAASLSIASAANTVILVWFLRRNGIPGVQAIILPCLGYAAKIAAVSVVVAGGLYLSKPFLLAPFAALSPRLGSLAFLAVGSVLFALAGFALLWVTGDQYVRWRGLHAKS